MSIHHDMTAFLYTTPDDEKIEVPFGILTDRNGASGQVRGWKITEKTVVTEVPGTNIVFTERLGFGLATTTWNLEFLCSADFYQLVELHGETGTLRVLYGSQSLKGSTIPTLFFGQHYEYLDYTRIADIGAPAHLENDVVEVAVTFTRAVDPVTRQAVVP